MTIDYANRDQLYRSAVKALGQEEADTLMASLPPGDWNDLVRTTEMDRRFTELERRMDLRFDKVDAQFVALGHEVRGDFEAALRTQTQWLVGGMGAMALSLFGVVIGILTLA